MSGKSKTIEPAPTVQVRKKPLKVRIRHSMGFYFMALPVIIFVVLIYYWPMLGIRYAFFSYKLRSIHWVGLENFRMMFSQKEFWQAFINTLWLSTFKLVLNTFAAVVIAIFLNEAINLIFKKVIQTVIYLPHFMSYAVVAAIFSLFLSPSSTGFVNETLKSWGWISQSIDFLHEKSMWQPIFFAINLWK